MTLDEIRVRIDAIDTQMKPLFVNRMECAAQVAAAKDGRRRIRIRTRAGHYRKTRI